QGAVDKLKEALEGEDIEPVKTAQEELTTASQKIGEALYAADQASEATGDAGEAAPEADEDVVDAEIVDEDEENKRPTIRRPTAPPTARISTKPAPPLSRRRRIRPRQSPNPVVPRAMQQT